MLDDIFSDLQLHCNWYLIITFKMTVWIEKLPSQWKSTCMSSSPMPFQSFLIIATALPVWLTLTASSSVFGEEVPAKLQISSCHKDSVTTNSYKISILSWLRPNTEKREEWILDLQLTDQNNFIFIARWDKNK